eukprot:2466204-Amphidinium_carterae.2
MRPQVRTRNSTSTMCAVRWYVALPKTGQNIEGTGTLRGEKTKGIPASATQRVLGTHRKTSTIHGIGKHGQGRREQTEPSVEVGLPRS